jgi:hypothetical protein
VRNYKLFKKATFEIFGENGQEFSVKTTFDYLEPNQPPTTSYKRRLSRNTGSSVWGTDKWGIMEWSGTTTVTAGVPLFIGGLGVSMAYTFLSREKLGTQGCSRSQIITPSY